MNRGTLPADDEPGTARGHHEFVRLQLLLLLLLVLWLLLLLLLLLMVVVVMLPRRTGSTAASGVGPARSYTNTNGCG